MPDHGVDGDSASKALTLCPSMSRRVALLLFLLAGCTESKAPHAIADPAADARPAPPKEVLSLPLVSGCGCAYRCAQGVRPRGDGGWDITHDLLDSTTMPATIERWCFDAKGHGYPEIGAPKEATDCQRVFHDRSPCGGECIPSTQYLHCR
jgi:hypothetical protein